MRVKNSLRPRKQSASTSSPIGIHSISSISGIRKMMVLVYKIDLPYCAGKRAGSLRPSRRNGVSGGVRTFPKTKKPVAICGQLFLRFHRTHLVYLLRRYPVIFLPALRCGTFKLAVYSYWKNSTNILHAACFQYTRYGVDNSFRFLCSDWKRGQILFRRII